MRAALLTIITCFLSTWAGAHTTDSNSYYGFEFEPNHGQFDAEIKFRSRIPNGQLYLTDSNLSFRLFNPQQLHDFWEERHGTSAKPTTKVDYHVFRFKWLNANPQPRVYGQNKYNYYNNYFFGNKPNKWSGNVPVYQEAKYQGVYNHIDFRIYSYHGSLKYDWLVQPGGNTHNIQWEIEGAEVQLAQDQKSYTISTSVGSITETQLEVYQYQQGKKVEIDAVFKLKNNVISIELLEEYDPGKLLVIDPTLIFSTYSGSRGDNFGFTATYDSRSHLIAGGIVDGDQGHYPVTVGAFQTTYGGGAVGGDGHPPVNLSCDISISKYDSAGKTLLYATYIGGVDDEFPHSLVVDNNDNLLILGTAYSDNFPVHASGYDTSFNDTTKETDIVVVKLTAAGDSLMGGTYIGGTHADGLNTAIPRGLIQPLRANYADDFRGDIIVDRDDNVFVGSCTHSKNFPTQNSFKKQHEGDMEGCVFSFSPNLDQLKWSTFIGGNKLDAVYSVRFSQDQNHLVIGGGTNSTNLESTTGTFITQDLGGTDGFIGVVSTQSKLLERFKLYGTTAYDQIYFIDVDNEDRIYGFGQTEGYLNKSANTYGDDGKTSFIFQTDFNFQKLNWQTTIGDQPGVLELTPSAFLVDNCYDIYISGHGPTPNYPTTQDKLQGYSNNPDFYLAVFENNAVQLKFGTYFGGSSTNDHVDGGTSRFDKRGVIYQSVCASCPPEGQHFNDFPVTNEAVFQTNVSPRCSNAAFKIRLQEDDVVTADFIVNPSKCGQQQIKILNRSTNGKQYILDYGDGQYDTVSVFDEIDHSYSKFGTYNLTLTAIDSLSCNVSDMALGDITIFPNPSAEFSMLLEPCSREIEFKSFVDQDSIPYTYQWTLDDSSGFTEPEFKHFIGDKKLGSAQLIVTDPNGCADTVIKAVKDLDQTYEELNFYNVFTPNNDGLNDCFFIEGFVDGCDEIEWIIYNRWGERVYKSDDILGCWDGKIQKTDKEVPEGTYFYVATYKHYNEKKTVSGTVELIRDTNQR